MIAKVRHFCYLRNNSYHHLKSPPQKTTLEIWSNHEIILTLRKRTLNVLLIIVLYPKLLNHPEFNARTDFCSYCYFSHTVLTKHYVTAHQPTTVLPRITSLIVQTAFTVHRSNSKASFKDFQYTEVNGMRQNGFNELDVPKYLVSPHNYTHIYNWPISLSGLLIVLVLKE